MDDGFGVSWSVRLGIAGIGAVWGYGLGVKMGLGLASRGLSGRLFRSNR